MERNQILLCEIGNAKEEDYANIREYVHCITM